MGTWKLGIAWPIRMWGWSQIWSILSTPMALCTTTVKKRRLICIGRGGCTSLGCTSRASQRLSRTGKVHVLSWDLSLDSVDRRYIVLIHRFIHVQSHRWNKPYNLDSGSLCHLVNLQRCSGWLVSVRNLRLDTTKLAVFSSHLQGRLLRGILASVTTLYSGFNSRWKLHGLEQFPPI